MEVTAKRQQQPKYWVIKTYINIYVYTYLQTVPQIGENANKQRYVNPSIYQYDLI